jgi:hypothetical protein
MELVENFSRPERPHIIMDAAFGSMALGGVLSGKGFTFTMGINRARKDGWLFNEMERFLSRGEGRVMVNKDGVAASLFYDNKMHTVLTTAWMKQRENDSGESDNEGRIESENEENNSEMSGSVEDIEEEVEGEEDEEVEHPGAEWVIATIQTRKKAKNKGFVYEVLWSTDETTWEPFCNLVDDNNINQSFIQFANEDDWKEGFSEWTLKRLHTLCAAYGISRSMW